MNKNKKSDHQKHKPVLLSEVVQYLDPSQGETFADMTAGYGGHSAALIGRTLQKQGTVLVDRDKVAVAYLADKFGSGVKILHQDFLSASHRLAQDGHRFDIILADLGVSSEHLDQQTRGFSFNNDGPLDMRMDQSQELTADDIVNSWSEKEIADTLFQYGGERYAYKIARLIVANRPVKSTGQLADIVKKAYGPKWLKTNPATKTFQAVRIAVNDELEQLERVLPTWIQLLNTGGRLAVISFHSLEDKLVKDFFRSNSQSKYDSPLKLLTKKPIMASKSEIEFNPRSRSAKLRVVLKK